MGNIARLILCAKMEEIIGKIALMGIKGPYGYFAPNDPLLGEKGPINWHNRPTRHFLKYDPNIKLKGHIIC